MAEQKTPNLSKRMQKVRGKVDHAKAYPVDDALALVKQTATAKFDESVDVAVNLGIDAKKSDQTVRGSVVLPAGTGKKVRVAVSLTSFSASSTEYVLLRSTLLRTASTRLGSFFVFCSAMITSLLRP